MESPRATRCVARGRFFLLGFFLVRQLGVEVEESLAGEVIGHGLSDSAQLGLKAKVLPNQSLAIGLWHLEDVGVISPSRFGVAKAPEALDPHTGFFIFIFKHSCKLP